MSVVLPNGTRVVLGFPTTAQGLSWLAHLDPERFDKGALACANKLSQAGDAKAAQSFRGMVINR